MVHSVHKKETPAADPDILYDRPYYGDRKKGSLSSGTPHFMVGTLAVQLTQWNQPCKNGSTVP